jgi:hypothetical protein
MSIAACDSKLVEECGLSAKMFRAENNYVKITPQFLVFPNPGHALYMRRLK